MRPKIKIPFFRFLIFYKKIWKIGSTLTPWQVLGHSSTEFFILFNKNDGPKKENSLFSDGESTWNLPFRVKTSEFEVFLLDVIPFLKTLNLSPVLLMTQIINVTLKICRAEIFFDKLLVFFFIFWTYLMSCMG